MAIYLISGSWLKAKFLHGKDVINSKEPYFVSNVNKPILHYIWISWRDVKVFKAGSKYYAAFYVYII